MPSFVDAALRVLVALTLSRCLADTPCTERNEAQAQGCRACVTSVTTGEKPLQVFTAKGT